MISSMLSNNQFMRFEQHSRNVTDNVRWVQLLRFHHFIIPRVAHHKRQKKNDEFANRFFAIAIHRYVILKKNENESEMKNFFFIEILPFIFLKKIHSFIYSLLDIKYRNIAWKCNRIPPNFIVILHFHKFPLVKCT